MWARSYTLRAVLAVLLLVGFYAVALGLGLGLIALPFGVAIGADRISPKLFLVCLVAGGTILWSLLPRRTPWEDPGPLLTEAEQPRLFAVIREVARAMNSRMPDAVYLIPDVNAWVTQRGGVLGLGSRRLMGIGLGLLAVDNVSQLRATIAHEFGHYEGGETRLSGLTYATRAAMGRTLHNLEEQGSTVLRKPFEWMMKLFMLLTQAVSRQQELLADEWSVRLEGKTAHLTGLEAEAVHGVGFGFYLRQEIEPLTRMGVAPRNLFAGYRAFLKSSGWKEAQPRVAEQLAKREADPYDSHPGHEERLAYARALPLPDKAMDETPAYTLLENAEALEKQFTARLAPESLERVSWEEVAARLGQTWKDAAARVVARTPDVTVGTLPALLADAAMSERFAETVWPSLIGYRLPDRAECVRATAAGHAGAYLAWALARQGYTWRTSPGEALALEKEGTVVEPWTLVRKLQEGALSPDALAEAARGWGLGPDARPEVEEPERAKALAPATEVRVLPAGPFAVSVSAKWDPLVLPRCCPVCLGDASYEVSTSLPVHGQKDTALRVTMVTCEAHRNDVDTTFAVEHYEQGTDHVTLTVRNPGYAQLLQRANA
jgi:Zn-dependent protease with chaperone function